MKTSIAIIGGGASALMLAAQLSEAKFDVTIYESNSAVGRKFLVAGDGGFNLTHSEALEKFISRYTPSNFLNNSITSFTNNDLRDWFKSIGIETFIGSSKRIFPVEGIKPIDVLNAILKELKRKNVVIKTNFKWKGFDDADVKANITIFALGGSSWKVTGSDGSWTTYFSERGIDIIPFQASNCAYEVNWKDEFISIVEGRSLKNITVKCHANERKGELVITKFGLEGGTIYALSPEIRTHLNKEGFAKVYIDLKPSLTVEQIKDKFRARGNRTIKKLLIDRLNFDDTQIELLKTILSKDNFTNLEMLANKIKELPITINSTAPLDDAISTVGGISLNEVDSNFQVKKLPNTFCIGEMLDWDAPTGGYLLQGCFSMGYYLAQHLNKS
ncbi:MAG: NAD(P)-dependent oxidoreductase [Bacteroidota bacterium]|nr:NAD(P)-dependent oxidoreductase [Bacteroidota bacterium]